jgi:hypothetical protein
MEKELDAILLDATKRLLAAPMSCKEAKAAANAYLKSRGTPKEKAQLAAYIKELGEDITGIDDLVAFAGSSYAEKEFGKEGAKAFLAHAKALKESGARYCDCPACTAAKDILDLKKELLK